MKKYILTLVGLIATMSINAQVVCVYKNNRSELVAAYTITSTDKYKVELAPASLLPGLFTVGAGADGKYGFNEETWNDDDKKVLFTNGNLYWDGSDFKLEANQTDFPRSWNTDHVGHFFWTKEAANSYAYSYSDGTKTTSDVPFFAESKGGLTIEGITGLFVLTKDEWDVLIYDRPNAASLNKYGVSVTHNNETYTYCLIIAPDNFTGTLKDSYTLEEVNSLGLVCLPAAGYRNRNSTEIESCNYWGYYWSSTPMSDNSFKAWHLAPYRYDGGGVRMTDSDRDTTNSLRLVKLAK